MEAVVDEHTTVSDGDTARDVYDSNIIEDHETVTVETRRGFELTGSNNHRVRRPDGEWVRLDELEIGDEIEVSGGNGIWPDEYSSVDWSAEEYRSLDDVAADAGVSVWTVLRYRKTGRAERAEEIEAALSGYDDSADVGLSQRDMIRVPDEVTEEFGRFLGLLVGDGHVPANSQHVGFTAAERERAEEFAGLVSELFGVEPTVERQDSRWRVYAYSEHLRDLLTETFDLPTGEAAAEKAVPEQICRSPKSVVAEFLRGLHDADGYAGDQGVILSTKSDRLSETVQLLLTNFGILSRRREQTDGCYHVHLTGESAATFADEIGFGYDEKSDALSRYLDELAWFETESWTDEITQTETGTRDVFDISVEETHRYAAGGFVNHNSYWESTMMAGERFAADDEFVLYADHMAKVLGAGGLNPYKLGLEIWEYVENTENRREVVERLLRTEGITWRNFHDVVDFQTVQEQLKPPAWLNDVPSHLDDIDSEDPRVDSDQLAKARDGAFDVETYPWKVLTYEGLVQRHYSLLKPQYRGFVSRIGQEELERVSRYLFDQTRYDDVETALADVDYSRGWDRMRDLRTVGAASESPDHRQGVRRPRHRSGEAARPRARTRGSREANPLRRRTRHHRRRRLVGGRTPRRDGHRLQHEARRVAGVGRPAFGSRPNHYVRRRTSGRDQLSTYRLDRRAISCRRHHRPRSRRAPGRRRRDLYSVRSAHDGWRRRQRGRTATAR